MFSESYSLVHLSANISPDQGKVEYSGHLSFTKEMCETRPRDKSLRKETTVARVPVTYFQVSDNLSSSTSEDGRGKGLHVLY